MNELNQLAQDVVHRSGALLLYARQWLDPASAEDVVQEALVSLLSQKRAPSDAIAWMYRAVRHAAIDHARSRWRRDRRERIVAECKKPWLEAPVDALIDARAAEEALRRMPGEQREIVVLRIWSGLSFAQIAEVTRSSISTVHDRYAAALKQIRRELETPCPTRTK
jgi:RNA polymerase sigma-70 factor (ECF subfamily)